MKITLPKNLDNTSVRQASAMMEYVRENQGEWGLTEMCEMISILSGIETEQIKKADLDSVIAAFKHIQSIIQRSPRKPPTEVEIEGETYVFNQDFRAKEWTAGRYIDSSNKALDLEKHPELLVAICYVEKGKKYGDVPLTDRGEVMRKGFKGSDYIDLVGFFLQKYGELKPGYSLLNLARSLPRKS